MLEIIEESDRYFVVTMKTCSCFQGRLRNISSSAIRTGRSGLAHNAKGKNKKRKKKSRATYELIFCMSSFVIFWRVQAGKWPLRRILVYNTPFVILLVFNSIRVDMLTCLEDGNFAETSSRSGSRWEATRLLSIWNGFLSNRKRTCTRWPALRPCFKLETVDDVVYGIGCFFFGMEAQQHLPVGFHSRGKKEIKEPRSWPSFEGMSLTLDWTCVTSLVGVNWPPA